MKYNKEHNVTRRHIFVYPIYEITQPPPPRHSYTWQVNSPSTVATSECLNLCYTFPMKSIVIEKSKGKRQQEK